VAKELSLPLNVSAGENAGATGKAVPGRDESRMTERVDDAALVSRAERGEKAAFDELVSRYLDAVVAAAFSILGDKDAASDCAQDAFMEAVSTLDRLREKEKFGSWVYHISKRKAIYLVRRQRMHGEAMKVKSDENRAMGPEKTPAEEASHNERLDSIRRALGEIPPIYREVLTLKYIDSRSHEDIAQLLQISLAAVDKRLMRGKEMLRQSLERWKSEE
jgi:RNA polymerase sigma-70 factor (ECF subfamily)